MLTYRYSLLSLLLGLAVGLGAGCSADADLLGEQLSLANEITLTPGTGGLLGNDEGQAVAVYFDEVVISNLCPPEVACALRGCLVASLSFGDEGSLSLGYGDCSDQPGPFYGPSFVERSGSIIRLVYADPRDPARITLSIE